LEAACAEAGVKLRVAVVEGDDLMSKLDELRAGRREGSGVGRPLACAAC